jgi:hypothetical protein
MICVQVIRRLGTGVRHTVEELFALRRELEESAPELLCLATSDAQRVLVEDAIGSILRYLI